MTKNEALRELERRMMAYCKEVRSIWNGKNLADEAVNKTLDNVEWLLSVHVRDLED